MSLNPQFFPAPSLQQGFIDKGTGLPLSFGLVFFYKDQSRTILKPIYELSGSPPNYTYTALPNPVILSGIGTFQDATGNDIIPYYFPFDSNGNVELYYIVVTDQFGIQQFTRQGFPNETEIVTGLLNFSENFVPNGQFLLNNPPASYPTTAYTFNYGAGVINKVIDVAPGGWTFQVTNGSTAVDTIKFNQLLTELQVPSSSPRYEIEIIRSVAHADPVCDLRIRFMDVNKFQGTAPNGTWSFLFNAASSSSISGVNIRLIKYFGTNGSVVTPADVTEDIAWGGPFDITNGQQTFAFPNEFGFNIGNAIGDNNNDFIELAIRFPASAAQLFDVRLTDFMLINANITQAQANALDFPETTNGEFTLQALSNIAPTTLSNTTNNYYQEDGSNLYLPMVMTKSGFTYDYSEIGTVVSKFNLLSVNNELLCDGASYISGDYSSLGVPYRRLANILTTNSSVANVPMFGTGLNFADAYIMAGATNIIRITNNLAGTGTFATDGSTGYTFTNMVTGFANISLKAYSFGSNAIFVAGTGFVTPLAPIAAGTSGFGVSTGNIETGYLAFQSYSVSISTVAAAALANPGGIGLYFQISNSTTTFYFWFKFTNETDPAPGGTGVQINMPSTSLTAVDVAGIIREAINGFQMSSITVTAVPTSGQYFLFETNPGSPRNFLVWYNVAGTGTAPSVAGRTNIEVRLLGTETNAQVATKTQTAIDAYQFAVPDLRGLFLRGTDPIPLWDSDNTVRFSLVSGMSGAVPGTFEYSQFLQHLHTGTVGIPVGTGVSTNTVGNDGAVNTGTQTNTLAINNAGGSETRPVNIYVNYFIKY